MNSRSHQLALLVGACALAAASGCAQQPEADPADTVQVAPVQVAQPMEAPVQLDREAPAELDPTEAPEPFDLSAPSANQGAGASKAAAAKMTAWSAVHAFLGQTIVTGNVISPTEAIALTKNNHVGVTQDGGTTWSFVHHANGQVLAVTGSPGGPYIATGRAGYMATSADGKIWKDLARQTNDDLRAVTVGGNNVVAVGKAGVWVSWPKGLPLSKAGLFPNKFKATGLWVDGGNIIAFAGKKGYSTADGTSWLPMAVMPVIPKGREWLTSRGVCKVGKILKNKGVVCTVAGLARGFGDNHAIVDQKKSIAITSDGGNTWKVSLPPFKGMTAIVGPAGGPYYALGGGGQAAVTKDGTTWQPLATNAGKTLRAGVVKAGTIVLSGDGVIVRSTDGGATFVPAETPIGGSFKQLFDKGGKLFAVAGSKAIESADGGATWTEVLDVAGSLGDIPSAKPGTCDARLPAAGETCKFTKSVKSPAGDLPNVRGVVFNGDVGLAAGDSGLLMMTANGGATWSLASSVTKKPIKRIEGMAVRGDRVVVVGGKDVVVSVNGGKSFARAELPGKAKVMATHIAEDGSAYVAGTKGAIFKSIGDLTAWLQLDTGPKNKAQYIYLHEVGKAVYASGKKGELYRSEDGQRFFAVASGIREPVQKMTGDGNTVLAVTYANRNGNHLLRSDDGGRRFYVQREVSDWGGVSDFDLAGGNLTYEGRISDDFGATWTKAPGVWRSRGIPLGDGSGLKLHVSRPYKMKGTLMIAGTTGDDWTIIDSFDNRGAWFECSAGTGCWMVRGGQIYRPL